MTDLLETHRSTVLRLMTASCWIAIALGVATIALTVWCASVLPGTGAMAEFAAGFVQSAGFDPATFGATEAGEMSSIAVITLVAAGLALVGIRRRRPMLARTSAVAWLLFAVSAAAFLGAALALIVLAGSFVPSARRWFAGAEPSLGSLERDAQSV